MYRIQAARALTRGVYAAAPCHSTAHATRIIHPSAWRLAFATSSRRYTSVTIKVPTMAESISEGTISQIHKSVGDHVEADEEVLTIETDKIDVSVNASEGGVIAKILAEEGQTVSVGQDLIIVEPGEVSAAREASPPQQQDPPKQKEASPPPQQQEKKPESTEPKSNDTTSSTSSSTSSTSPASAPPSSAPPKQQTQTPGPTQQAAPPGPSRPGRTVYREKISRMRKTIATRLKESQNKCASLTTVQRVDMSALMAWRAKNKEAVAKMHDVRLGYMGAFAKATSMAAQRVPQVNASIDTDRGFITYRDYVDISIAVSTPKGLVTPVIHDCDTKSIIEIERDVALVAQKARDSKLTMADLEGGNFSISNPGIFGSMFGTPLINYPQAAVFNMNTIKEDVVAVHGKVEIRPMMYITLTYDHRLIDGREAVTFLNIVKGYIEDPSSMLL